jgi:hypothetical protein
MKKKTLTKLDQLIAEHKAYNDQYKHDKRLQIRFHDYVAWINGTTKIKRNKNSHVQLVKPVWANSTDHIQSVIGTAKAALSKNTMVEKAKLGIIDSESASSIISKSKRIGLAYSKGSYQYITEGTDLKTIGKKTQSL